MTTLTAEQLKEILPAIKESDVEKYMPFLTIYMPKYYISTPQRIGAFIAQTGEESINFSDTLEGDSGAAYEGRKDLGNTQPGDGVKFKGRGLIQVTGRSNYHACSISLFRDDRLLETPEILLQPEFAVASACWFWANAKGLNQVADDPENWVHPGPHQYTKFQWITILINGGLNGYAQRLTNYIRARTALGF